MTLPAAAMVILLGIVVLQCIAIFRRSSSPDGISPWLLLSAGVLLLGVTIYRSILIRFIAVTNTWESLIFLAALITLVLFVLCIRRGGGLPPYIILGGSLFAMAFLALSSSPITSPELRPPIPALRSHWLVLHVVCSFIGEAFFTVSFVAAVVRLLSPGDEGRRTRAEGIMYSAVAIGYPFFTMGALIFGAVWAEYAWGTFWSWDPKETWALVTWLIYTAFLHLRHIGKIRGILAVVLLMVGFVFMIFTFFGVNFLLSGLHSYG